MRLRRPPAYALHRQRMIRLRTGLHLINPCAAVARIRSCWLLPACSRPMSAWQQQLPSGCGGTSPPATIAAEACRRRQSCRRRHSGIGGCFADGASGYRRLSWRISIATGHRVYPRAFSASVSEGILLQRSCLPICAGAIAPVASPGSPPMPVPSLCNQLRLPVDRRAMSGGNLSDSASMPSFS